MKISLNDGDGIVPVEIHNFGDIIVIERGFSAKTMSLTREDARKMAQAILELTNEPIPPGVYYSYEHDNFYVDHSRHGMGQKFYNEWKSRCKEFPISDKVLSQKQLESEKLVCSKSKQYPVRLSLGKLANWKFANLSSTEINGRVGRTNTRYQFLSRCRA